MSQQFSQIEAAIKTAKESRDAAQEFISEIQALYRLISDNENWFRDVTVLDVINHPVFGKQYQKFLKKRLEWAVLRFMRLSGI